MDSPSFDERQLFQDVLTFFQLVNQTLSTLLGIEDIENAYEDHDLSSCGHALLDEAC